MKILISLNSAKSVTVGHGHIFPRSDDIRMRCGGPKRCAHCIEEVHQGKPLDELTSVSSVKKANIAPIAAQKAAIRGLALRKEFGRGGTLVGVKRANQLKNKENLSEKTIRRMKAFFDRHEVDKKAKGFRKNEDGYPSAGKIANLLWGGDPGYAWAKKKVAQFNKERG